MHSMTLIGYWMKKKKQNALKNIIGRTGAIWILNYTLDNSIVSVLISWVW